MPCQPLIVPRLTKTRCSTFSVKPITATLSRVWKTGGLPIITLVLRLSLWSLVFALVSCLLLALSAVAAGVLVGLIG
jgi:hypothetical protein